MTSLKSETIQYTLHTAQYSVASVSSTLLTPVLQDLHYFSDSEHQSSGLMPRQELRRLRNRTLSGLDSLRLGEQVTGPTAFTEQALSCH